MDSVGFEIPLQCNYCNKSFSGAVPAKQHFDSVAHKKKEATARQAASTGTSSLNVCDVCNISCDTLMILEQHKASPKHLANVEKKQQFVQLETHVHQASSALNQGGLGAITTTGDQFQGRQSQGNYGKEYDFDGSKGYCYLCDIQLTSKQHATQHLNGKQHKKKQVVKGTINMIPPQQINPQVDNVMIKNAPASHIYSQKDSFAYEETQEKQVMSSQFVGPFQGGSPNIGIMQRFQQDIRPVDGTSPFIRHVQSNGPIGRPVQSYSPGGRPVLSRGSDFGLVESSSPVNTPVQSYSPVFRLGQSNSPFMKPVHSNSPSNDKLYCEICDIRVESLDAMVDHLKSSKHETNLLNRSIKSSRSSSISSANEMENILGNNPQSDYVSYSAISQQMSELMVSDEGHQRYIPNCAKPEPIYGDFRIKQLQKFFNTDSANLNVDSLVSEEGLSTYRTAVEPDDEEIIAKPFPREESQRGLEYGHGTTDNRQTETLEAGHYDGQRVMNRSISSCTTSSEPGPAEFIRNNLKSSGQNTGPSSLPVLVNNADRPVGIGRGLLQLNIEQPAQLITKQSNLMRQNFDQFNTLNSRFEDAHVKHEQKQGETSDNTDLSTLLHNFKLEDKSNASSSRESIDDHSTTYFEYSINAKPFPTDTVRPSPDIHENSVYTKPLSEQTLTNTMPGIPPQTVGNRETEYTFDRHLSRGHCNICDIALTSVEHMEQHLSGRKHKNAVALKQTVSSQTVFNKELFCDVCLVPFSGPEAQEQHMKSDKHRKKLEQKTSKPTVFVCDICKIECSGEDNYRKHLEGEKHMKRVNGPMPGQMFNKCEICNCFVNTLDQLEIHQRAKHPEKFRSNPETEISQFNTNLMSNLHVSAGNQGSGAISGRPGFFYCDVCKIETSGEDNYRQHLIGEKHRKKLAKGGNDKPDVYVCSVCKVECSGEDNYKQHLAGEKHRKKAPGCVSNQIQSQCEICNCVVNSQEQLQVHQRVKHPEKFQTVSVVGRGTFDQVQTAIQCMGPNGSDNSLGNRHGSFPNPLEEFLSLELFPEHKDIGDAGNNEPAANERQSKLSETKQGQLLDRYPAGVRQAPDSESPFITPEITTAHTVESKPRFATMPNMTDNENGLGQGNGGRRTLGSDLAFATKNRSIGNQLSSASEKPGVSGSQNSVSGTSQQVAKVNPFAATHPYYCHTCNAPANTRESYETHLQGKRHMAKVGIESAAMRPHVEGRDLRPGFKPQTQSVPRDYQLELYNNAMKSDSVCFLPTGTGKTLVSVMLMSAMLEKYPTRPVLFVVDKVLLVLQQSKYITTELGELEFTRYNPDSRTLSDIGRRRLCVATLCMDQQSTHGVPLWKHDIVVVTAAFCQNLLDREIIRWQDFSLVVFDEAHHCDKKHPFNMLLYSHHLKIMGGKYRPKILGLTASPAGKESVPATLRMLEKLVGNMGGVSMNIVQKHKSTLAKFQSNAEIIIRPQPDQFNEIVTMFVLELHVYLVYCYLRLVPISDINVYLAMKDVNQSSNDDQIRLVAECNKMADYYLEEYQLAVANIQCHNVENKYNVRLLGKHAESICMTLNSLLEGGVPCALEEMTGLQNEEYNFEFAKTFNLPCEKLQLIYNHTKGLLDNPKELQFDSHISRLVEELTNSLDIDWSQRETVKPMALVLVKERATVHRITHILQNNEVMRRMNLQVTSVVGHGKTGSEAAGMKVNQQKRILEEIKQYKYQVIVATSVAEEGVDWPECELVVSLYPPSTLTALVQMRGRARKKNSKFVVLCSSEVEREIVEDLKKRENNMIEASEILYHRNLETS